MDYSESLQGLIEEGRFHLRCYRSDERDLKSYMSEQQGRPVSQVWLGCAAVTATTPAKMSVT